MKQEFQKINKKIDRNAKGIKKNADSIDKLALAMKKGFDDIDKKFIGIDKKFIGIDKKFIGIDKKFAKVDRRFIAMEKHIDTEIKASEKRILENTAGKEEIRKVMNGQVEILSSIKELKEDKQDRAIGIEREQRWREIATGAMKENEILSEEQIEEIEKLGVFRGPKYFNP